MSDITNFNVGANFLSLDMNQVAIAGHSFIKRLEKFLD